MNSQQPDPNQEQDPNQEPPRDNPVDEQFVSSSGHRAFQREDPDVLHDIVNQRNTRNRPAVQKLTSDNVRSLRSAGGKESGAGVGLTRMIAGFFSGLGAAFVSLFMFAPKTRKNRQCEDYGHMPPEPGTWSGPYPKCVICGAEITSPDQLRKSTNK